MSQIYKKFINFGTGTNQVNSQDLPANFTPTNYTPTQVSSEGTTKVSAHLKGIDNALASATGAPTLFGSRGTPRNITTSGITSAGSHMSTTSANQVVFVQGSGGAVTVTANPQIEASTVTGARMVLIGRSDTNTLSLTNGNGLELSGPITLYASSTLSLMFDGTSWIELTRSI